LAEIDEGHVPAVGTAGLLPYHRKLLACCGGPLKIVRKLKEAIEKPILAVEPIVGHDRRRPGPPRGQRKAATRQHQGASWQHCNLARCVSTAECKRKQGTPQITNA